ncbi:hypothetical protein N7492_009950 [Penicillium capsulatum]|uniref:Uncharacterized protein n=1 Tax=Penicillium capsulatum TaxID=69766 RepID=A0A9W9LEZ2_9EURO|nr:hypothetical protein N7492_009950 [Penicillium capsulatum]KAJ6112461.1 hypothetical protein N7512_007785 [Penicillium capsulatum]
MPTTKTPYEPETTKGKTTSFQPLTTTFTPPSACKSAYVWEDRLVGYDPGYGVSVDTNLACGPGAFTTWWMQGHLGDGDTRISIGPMTCPQDWSTVATSVRSKSSTLEMCCPSGYHLTSGKAGQVTGECVSDITSGMTLTYRSQVRNGDSYATKTTTMRHRSTVGAIGLVGWNIDYPIAPSTTMTNSMTTSTSGTGPANTDSKDSNHDANVGDSTGDGLSSGAKAGIGIGVGVGSVGVIALLVALWMFRRRKSKPSPSTPVTQNPQPTNMYPPSTHPPDQPLSQQPWYQPPGSTVPSNSDHLPSSTSQASGALATGALQSSGASNMHSETIISSITPASNHQRDGSVRNAPQLHPVEAPSSSDWIPELQGSAGYASEAQSTQPVANQSHSPLPSDQAHPSRGVHEAGERD